MCCAPKPERINYKAAQNKNNVRCNVLIKSRDAACPRQHLENREAARPQQYVESRNAARTYLLVLSAGELGVPTAGQLNVEDKPSVHSTGPVPSVHYTGPIPSVHSTGPIAITNEPMS